MALQTYMERLEFIDSLIRRKATGNIQTLAKKLNLSKSHTERIIKEMRDMNFPISYSRSLNSYYYTQEGRLVSKLFTNSLTNEEMRSVNGGKTFFELFLEPHYMSFCDSNFV